MSGPHGGGQLPSPFTGGVGWGQKGARGESTSPESPDCPLGHRAEGSACSVSGGRPRAQGHAGLSSGLPREHPRPGSTPHAAQQQGLRALQQRSARGLYAWSLNRSLNPTSQPPPLGFSYPTPLLLPKRKASCSSPGAPPHDTAQAHHRAQRPSAGRRYRCPIAQPSAARAQPTVSTHSPVLQDTATCCCLGALPKPRASDGGGHCRCGVRDRRATLHVTHLMLTVEGSVRTPYSVGLAHTQWTAATGIGLLPPPLHLWDCGIGTGGGGRIMTIQDPGCPPTADPSPLA